MESVSLNVPSRNSESRGLGGSVTPSTHGWTRWFYKSSLFRRCSNSFYRSLPFHRLQASDARSSSSYQLFHRHSQMNVNQSASHCATTPSYFIATRSLRKAAGSGASSLSLRNKSSAAYRRSVRLHVLANVFATIAIPVAKAPKPSFPAKIPPFWRDYGGIWRNPDKNSDTMSGYAPRICPRTPGIRGRSSRNLEASSRNLSDHPASLQNHSRQLASILGSSSS